MGDAIRRTVVFVQEVQEILRKRNDERAKCPRCRGSGLLNLPSIWHRSPASNAPCLFCEGGKIKQEEVCTEIGVMPTVGLRGYMIGRTDALLSTTLKEKHKNRHSVVPNNLHPDNAKCKSSTKLSTCRHFKVASQLRYNPLSNPAWLLEAHREAALMKLSSHREAMEMHSFEDGDSEDRSNSAVGLIGLDQAGWRHRHRFYARTSASFSNPTASPARDTSRDAASFRVREAADGSLHPIDSGRGLQEHKHRHGVFVEFPSGRGRRSCRRPRNRIREKAAKEAEARARRVQKSATLQVMACEAAPIHSRWHPLLSMCRSLLLRSTTNHPKKLPLIIPKIHPDLQFLSADIIMAAA